MKFKTGWAIALSTTFFIACGGGQNQGAAGKESEQQDGSTDALFKELKLPYALSDTALQNWRDTTAIRSAIFAANIPDSVKTKLFSKNAKNQIPAIRQNQGH